MGKPLGSLDIPPYAIGASVRVETPYDARYGRSVGVIDRHDSDTIRARVYFSDGRGGFYSELLTLEEIAPVGWPIPDDAEIPPATAHLPLFPALLTCGHHPDYGCDCDTIAAEADDQG